jgi:hypothetical protein
MKAFIILGLVALVCSQSAFLRDLQEATEITTVPDAGQPQAAFTALDLVISGVWTVTGTNCSDLVCAPQILVVGDSQQAMLTLMYPVDAICGAKSGQNVTVNETTYNGYWTDVDANSPLFGWSGIYHLNNKTEYVYRTDSQGNFCWANLQSVNSTNTSGVVPTNKTWEGVWNMTSYFVSREGRQCCLPVIPTITVEDLETQTVEFMGQVPDCEACGAGRGTISHVNTSIAGGSAYFVTSYLYVLEDGTTISNSPDCTLVFERILPTTC